MDFKDLVALYFERTNAFESLWSIYITIVLGLIGFVGAVQFKTHRFRILIPLLVAFCGFAYVNGDALRSVTDQRNIVKDLIQRRRFKDPVDQVILERISASLDPSAVASVVCFHLLADALTISAMLVLGLRRSETVGS